MGKALIIKGADFAANAVDTISELYEDITDELIQGVVAYSGGGPKVYNASYNNTSTLIPKYLVLMASTTSLYDTHDKGVEWFIPATLKVLPFVHKTTSTIDSGGAISGATMSSGGDYIDGGGTWVKASDIYTKLGASSSTYPCYNVSICTNTSPTNPLSLADAKALGLRVRRLKATE